MLYVVEGLECMGKNTSKAASSVTGASSAAVSSARSTIGSSTGGWELDW